MEALKAFESEQAIDASDVTPMKRADSTSRISTKTCNLCKKELPVTQFRQSVRNPKRRIATCMECDAKYNPPRKVPEDFGTADAATSVDVSQEKITKDLDSSMKSTSALPEILAGFELCQPGIKVGDMFITVSERGISLSASAIRAIGADGKVDIYYHKPTGRIGVHANPKGKHRLTHKRGSGSISCKAVIKEYGISPVGRMQVEIHGNAAVTVNGGKDA